MTLYLKYRPQKIEELDLASVRKQLMSLIQSKDLPHAFLFSGPKGTGKTSSARILAKAINCEKNTKTLKEPCNTCDHCMSITRGADIDVIEMDAASNRGIDDIRVLREQVKLSPAHSLKKIYIIDEAHMLTTEAANALLKTLEEPPAHVIFILATTNPEKLPTTIHSRLTVVNFTKATTQEIADKLDKIAKSEKYDVEKEAIEVLAKSADGSFRDAVKLLENAHMQSPQITKESVHQLLYGSNTDQSQAIYEALIQKNAKDAVSLIEQVATTGGSVKLLTDEILTKLHQEVLRKTSTDTLHLITLLIASKQELQYSPIAQLPLQLAILKWCNGAEIAVIQEQKIETTTITVKEESPVVKNEEISSKKVESPAPDKKKFENIDSEGLDVNIWNKILIDVRTKNASIEALLRAAKPLGFDGSTLTLGVYYKFHKERLEVGTNMRILEDVIASIVGKNVRVSCMLTERPANEVSKKDVVLSEPKSEDLVKVAKEIFGA